MDFETKNNQLYTKALTHKSYSIKENNERLEFLGDSILSTIVSEYLFLKNKNKSEGFLSQQRALIVSRKHLNKIGKKIIKPTDLKSDLKIIPDKIFGNTLEAILGAIYIDKGIKKTKEFVVKNIINSTFIKEISVIDNKIKLQEKLQKKNQKPQYKLIKSKGPDHNKEFTVAIYINKVKITEAKESSIKEAEQKAAKKALNIVL